MSALTEKAKAERLRFVMAAAKHVITEDARSQSESAEFLSGSIFPDGLARHELSAPEYSWRSQICWCWARAGYMRDRLEGRGVAKHYIYTLTSAGRIALSKLAVDPIAASFYVPLKRSYGAEREHRDVEWYQPPELRKTVRDRMPADSPREMAPPPDDEDEFEEMEEGEPDASDGPETEAAPPHDPAAATLAVFFDRSIAVLERMDQRLEAFDARMARLEGEVKTQSELVLDVAGRSEATASLADLRALTEQVTTSVTSAVGGLAKHDPDVRRELLGLHKALDTVHADLAATRTLVADLATRPAPVATTSLPDDVLRGIGEMRAQVNTICTLLQAPFAMTLTDDENYVAVKDTLDRLAAGVVRLVDGVSTAEEAYVKALAIRRKDLDALNHSMQDLAEAANTVIDGAKFVAGEIMSRTVEQVSANGVPQLVAQHAHGRALETFAAAKNANRNRATALGGALLRLDSFVHTGKIDPIVVPGEETK